MEKQQLWQKLCRNAEILKLDMDLFGALKDFFNTLDMDFFAGCSEKTLSDFPHEEAGRVVGKENMPRLYLLCIVDNYDSALELHQKNNWPMDVFNDLKCWECVAVRDFGFWGLSARIFSWQQDCFKGVVKQFGRLQCNDISLFAPKLSLYRQKDGSILSRSAFEKGNPPHPDLTYGDKVINLHIPASGPLKMDECRASIRAMCRFCEEFYPDWDFKAVVCSSWLLDPQFREFLPESANIIRFQKLGHSLTIPGWDATRETIWRIWGAPGLDMPFEKLPARTTLEKGSADFLRQGRRFQEGLLVIFRDELAF